MNIFSFAAGVLLVIKGEIQITRNRKVSGLVGRILGVLLMLGGCAGSIDEIGMYFQVAVFVIVIILGLIFSDKMEAGSEANELPET